MTPKHQNRMKEVTVELDNGDVQRAVEVGRARDGVYDGKGKANVDGSERTKIHIMGAKGEFALARYWNIPPNDVVLDEPDPGYDYDVVVGDVDVRVDVKTTKYFGDEHLKVPPSKTSVPDIFVLAGVDGVTVRLCGFISAHKLITNYDPVDDFENPVYRLTIDELRPLPAPDEVTVKA